MLLVHCPKCKVPCAMDFAECMALTCTSCSAFFCGYCCEEAPSDEECHEHVREEHTFMFPTSEEWTTLWLNRHRAVIDDILGELSDEECQIVKQRFSL